MSTQQIDLQTLWKRMSPEQRAKYADRFRKADAVHASSYTFSPPVVIPTQPTPTPSVPTPSDKRDDDKKDGKKDGLSDKDIEKDFR